MPSQLNYIFFLFYQLTIEGLEKERDFYFSKLRDIEVIAQEYEAEGGELVTKTLNVLYQTEVSLTNFITSFHNAFIQQN